VKGVLLVSETIGALRLVMRTRALAVDGPVTFQDWRPSLLVLDQRVVHVVPPFLECSIRTLPLTPLDVHRMFWFDPDVQLSPPLGAVTVRDPVIVKEASLVSEIVAPVTDLMRIRAWVVADPVTVQFWAPVLGTLENRVVQLEPLFRDSSIQTLPLRPVLLHRIVCAPPITQLSPPFGAVTLREAGSAWAR
jgi:hypothetical protein